MCFFFFFSSRRRHTRWPRDWSSDVCSSDLDKVLIAELIGLSPDPLTHTVIIDRGRRDGVYRGQAVLDAFGLMWQVVEVHDHSSRVHLITDSGHDLFVLITRHLSSAYDDRAG